jgi:hypothetical protein
MSSQEQGYQEYSYKERWFDWIYSYIKELKIATEEEVNLLVKIFGYTEQTSNMIIYYKTGYLNMDDYLDGEFQVQYVRKEPLKK